MVTTMLMPDETLAPPERRLLIDHLERAHPNEGCGVILRDARGELRVRPMANAQDRYHARDPENFPRTSRTAYLFDPREWLAVSEEADREGASVACIFHSHADVGAYFSAEDREMAAPEGMPLMPGVSYLVVAVDAGRAGVAKLFWWEGSGFEERPYTLIGT